jgi:hypothetical protein
MQGAAGARAAEEDARGYAKCNKLEYASSKQRFSDAEIHIFYLRTPLLFIGSVTTDTVRECHDFPVHDRSII